MLLYLDTCRCWRRATILFLFYWFFLCHLPELAHWLFCHNSIWNKSTRGCIWHQLVIQLWQIGQSICVLKRLVALTSCLISACFLSSICLQRKVSWTKLYSRSLSLSLGQMREISVMERSNTKCTVYSQIFNTESQLRKHLREHEINNKVSAAPKCQHSCL